MKKIAMLFGFLMLMFPVQVNGAIHNELSPIGINIELFECSLFDNPEDEFFFDIVVEKANVDLNYYNAVGNGYGIFPDELEGGEYTDFDNEWISIVYFFDYPDFNNEGCSVNFFPYEDLEYIGINEFKIVVYQKNEEPVTSVIYSVDLLPSYEKLEGYIFVYHADTKGFTKTAVVAEFEDYPSGWNSWNVLIAIGIMILIVIFGLLESIVYLISRRTKELSLISLLGNGVALAFVYVAVSSFRINSIVGSLMLVYVVLNIYAAKVISIHKYDENASGVSLLFSVVYSLITFFLAFSLI